MRFIPLLLLAVLAVAVAIAGKVIIESGMTLPELLALLVVAVAVPLNWLVAARLWNLSRGAPERWSLRSTSYSATGLAIIVSVFGFIFVNNGMKPPVLDSGETQLITRATLLAFSVGPAIYWLYLYRRRDG